MSYYPPDGSQPPPNPQYQGYPPQQVIPDSQQVYPHTQQTFYPQQPLADSNVDLGQPLMSQVRFNDIDTDPINYYGQIPQRQPRRYKTTKRVPLVDGNLVVDDCLVPSRLLERCPRKDDKEFRYMRYTAATCDPDDFKRDRYRLRQVDYGRQTELFIVLTMYDEDEKLFARTFHGVMKNIAHFCSRDNSRVWGPEGWQKIVVCVVADGRSKINSRVLHYLASIGVYQEGVAKNVFNGKPVTAHIYEYTTQLSIDSHMKFKGAEDGIVPVQVIFCLKEKNAKKINSHRWFFNAFGSILNPNVCVLLDVGTKPGSTSIYHLWKAFDLSSNVAGACGEIIAMKGTAGKNLVNPIVAAQNFEYKMSNILDKPFESVFGYITVLPGAFSAYRYPALQNNEEGEGPLAKYFKGEEARQDAEFDISTANMYLAEDRILCFELVAKKKCEWLLHYVKSAYAETDVPEAIPNFIKQRRRWLNGSLFAGAYAIWHTPAIWKSDHSKLRKFWLQVEMVYQTYNLIFTWFGLGNLYLTFYILGNSLTQPDVADGLWSPNFGEVFFQILRYIYLTLVVSSFILSMGNRPEGSKWSYTIIAVFFALLMFYMLFAAIWITIKGVHFALKNTDGHISGADVSTVSVIFNDSTFRNVILSVMSTYGLYFVASLLFFEPWHMFTSLAQYMLLIPFYINVLTVYAFCNIHDVSWGTRGEDEPANHLGAVATGPGENSADIEVPIEQKDINAAYTEAIEELHRVVEPEESHRSESTKQEDTFKSFRTRILLLWILSNGALITAITNTDVSSINYQKSSNGYMAFVLWSVVCLAAFRFLGSFTYLFFRLFTGY